MQYLISFFVSPVAPIISDRDLDAIDAFGSEGDTMTAADGRIYGPCTSCKCRRNLVYPCRCGAK